MGGRHPFPVPNDRFVDAQGQFQGVAPFPARYRRRGPTGHSPHKRPDLLLQRINHPDFDRIFSDFDLSTGALSPA